MIEVGSSIGAYRVLGSLGAGGMGEVYRASDERLRREVALKILPAHAAHDPSAIERLKREARVLAAISHPNIAAVYGLEEVDGRTLVAMELIPGDTLADCIRPGGMRIADVLQIARQIVDGVEAAHAVGVIHRDLKPANIKITPENRVKILDFGLARIFEPAAGSSDTKPTTTVTEAGAIVGTPAYMSPEQARGLPSDVRVDIWGIGCLLYELLTGRRAFEGETRSDVLVAVLDREPRWDRLPPATPPALQRLLRRCVQKDVSRRLHHVADVRIEIDQALDELSAAEMPVRRRRRWIAVAIVAALAVAAGGFWLASRQPATALAGPSPRFVIDLADGVPLDATRQAALALSPDGWHLVYVGERAGRRLLLSQTLGSFVTTALEGTDGGEGPFFSPSGEWVGFSAGGKLKKVSLTSGLVVALCDAADPRGAAWGDDDVITFAPGPLTGLYRVPAAGGTPQPVTELSGEDATHRWPHALPGGDGIIFTVGSKGAPSFDDADIAQLAVSTGRISRLMKGTFGRYADTGHLLFVRRGALMAARFRPESAATGTPAAVIESVGARAFSGTGWYDVSRSGTLVYASALGATDNMLVWVDRAGRAEPVTSRRAAYAAPRLSPDGSRIAVTVYAPDGTPDVWAYHRQNGSLSRLTLSGLNTSGVWSPDGKLLAYTSRQAGDPTFRPWVMPIDGSGPARRLPIGDVPGWSTSWSPRGDWLAYTQETDATGQDVMALPMSSTGQPDQIARSRYAEAAGVFSPDGRRVAYMSDESGRLEVYVRAFPHPGRHWQISVDGGFEPMWSRDGRELFFRQGRRLLAVPVAPRPGDNLSVGPPVTLFEGAFESSTSSGLANYDVVPPPHAFLMVQAADRTVAPRLTVGLNWFADVSRRVP